MPRYAAVDIGSNSVRMQVAEMTPGSPVQILANERQVTRLGESVFAEGRISADAMTLLESMLTQMAQTYKKLDVLAVRAVATAAVRDARNQREFIDRMSAAAGCRIEIISGQEEARLIHLGVQSTWPHPKQRVLMIDIGGGSMEIIDSEAGKIRDAYSKPLGAVRLTEVFLASDPPAPRELHRMENYIDDRLESAARRIGVKPWDRVIGTSATASALVCAANRIPRAKRDAANRLRATTAQIREIYHALASTDLAQRRKVTGIGARRAEIIVAGAAALLHALEAFGAKSIYYSAAGVRDGIIADLYARGAGRELSRLNSDQRRVVEDMANHYSVSLKHARKVAALAHSLFIGLEPLHRLPADSGKLLDAAAFLHDAGHYVSDTRHHKHSYYLVANSDMPGFTDREREIIANLCRYHRKSMPAPIHPNFQTLTPDEKKLTTNLIPILRLADALDRSHDQRLTDVQCTVRDNDVVLHLQSSKDIDLEQWAAEQAAETFQQIYGKPVTLAKAKENK
jgi:exopolyphosphatase/guanosine-5'-triphosphate,3'-diphosphate pyrophosphatase